MDAECILDQELDTGDGEKWMDLRYVREVELGTLSSLRCF